MGLVLCKDAIVENGGSPEGSEGGKGGRAPGILELRLEAEPDLFTPVGGEVERKGPPRLLLTADFAGGTVQHILSEGPLAEVGVGARLRYPIPMVDPT